MKEVLHEWYCALVEIEYLNSFYKSDWCWCLFPVIKKKKKK